MKKTYLIVKVICESLIDLFRRRKKFPLYKGLFVDIKEILGIKTINPINFSIEDKDRIHLINVAVDCFEQEDCKYLEIGVDNEYVFSSVNVLNKNKIGVDPAKGGTHRMTSCDFFYKNQQNKFDVIFIDGLHTYEQCKLDCINSLIASKDQSISLFHDMVPENLWQEITPRKYKTWTGNVWKVAVELSMSKNLDFVIANIDHGVGILKKKKGWEYLSNPDLINKNFKDFYRDYYKLLPIVTYDEAIKFIKKPLGV